MKLNRFWGIKSEYSINSLHISPIYVCRYLVLLLIGERRVILEFRQNIDKTSKPNNFFACRNIRAFYLCCRK